MFVFWRKVRPKRKALRVAFRGFVPEKSRMKQTAWQLDFDFYRESSFWKESTVKVKFSNPHTCGNISDSASF